MKRLQRHVHLSEAEYDLAKAIKERTGETFSGLVRRLVREHADRLKRQDSMAADHDDMADAA